MSGITLDRMKEICVSEFPGIFTIYGEVTIKIVDDSFDAGGTDYFLISINDEKCIRILNKININRWNKLYTSSTRTSSLIINENGQYDISEKEFRKYVCNFVKEFKLKKNELSILKIKEDF